MAPKARMPKLPAVPEAEVLKGCLAMLDALGVFAWRNNSGAFAGEYKGKRRFVRFGAVGSSDILGLLPDGRFLAVETKRQGNRPTEAQLGFLRRINASGGVGFWVDNTSAFHAAMDRILEGARVIIDGKGRPWITDEEQP